MEKKIHRLAQVIYQSVQNGQESEEIKQILEELTATEGNLLLETLKTMTLPTSANSLTIFYSYLLIIVKQYGTEPIKYWDSMILSTLSSPTLNLISSLYSLLQVKFSRFFFPFF